MTRAVPDFHGTAAGLAGTLASGGLEVTYVTPAGRVADWAGYAVELSRLQAGLNERGVAIGTGMVVSDLRPGVAGLTCAHTGRGREIGCGGFVPVTSREPVDQLWASLQDAGLDRVGRKGDARAPGLIAHAVHDGHRLACAYQARPEDLLTRRERVTL